MWFLEKPFWVSGEYPGGRWISPCTQFCPTSLEKFQEPILVISSLHFLLEISRLLMLTRMKLGNCNDVLLRVKYFLKKGLTTGRADLARFLWKRAGRINEEEESIDWMTSLAIQLRLPRSERDMCSTLKEEDKNAQGQVSPLSEEAWSSKGSCHYLLLLILTRTLVFFFKVVSGPCWKTFR